MHKHVATTVETFIRTINKISTQDGPLWFRGQSNANDQLTPNLLRNYTRIEPSSEAEEIIQKYHKESRYVVPSFETALSEFKRRARPFLTMTPQNDFEWMFIMQHYGAPTRLLDWTTNALVALYFAIPRPNTKGEYPALDDEEKTPEDYLDEFKRSHSGTCKGGAAVYVINPIKLNGHAQNRHEVVDISGNARKWAHYVFPSPAEDCDFPVCVSAPHIDRRIRSQSGVFTLHGSRIEPLDWYEALSRDIHKIYIPRGHWEVINKQMKSLGITTSFVFPDLDGVAREVKEDVVADFCARYKP
ncbi:FRG domain-containing protein [Noviherbaspirillum autotrophicum]|uniref:FRG domain-containing protein n=1 Tax=Noviherbaspirillum autotrophicum TaxID=709839 RepID=UPI00069448FC|nr:FRG domain-containing protein [Noviherbaspirillum autotrophicum]